MRNFSGLQMATLVESDWSPSGQGFVKSRKQSLQVMSQKTTVSKGNIMILTLN